MPENEFEKKVSSELQQLRFKPSETVWVRVEERIRKKKKRRVFIILFLIAGIALVGYWQWDNFFGGANSDIVKSETPVEEKNNTENNIDPNTKDSGSVNDQTQQTISAEKSDGDDKKVVTTNKPGDKSNNYKSEKIISDKIKIDSKKNTSPIEQKNRIPAVNKTDPIPDQKKQVDIAKDGPATVKTDDYPTIKDSTSLTSPRADNANQDLNQNVVPNSNKVDSTRLDTLVKKNEIRKDSSGKKADSLLKAIPADSPVVNIQKKPVKKKWSFGIEFIPGKSSFKEDIFSFNMNKSAERFNNAPQSGSGSGFPTGPASPSTSHSGFAFQFGGFFKRQFTKRSSLSAGLRWAYYTEQIRMGARMYPASSSPAFSQLLDALGVSSANGASGLTFYQTNKYHFIELPVNYILQLNKSDAHPLTMNAGVKAGRMFTSDAMVYDTAAGGIYYTSKKYFNKTQFGISTSLNWKITKKDKFYMAVGPVFDMHINSLLDNPYDKEKYLLFIGVRASVIFDSKK